ncbi:hypothetical protein [Vibrio brasiliensis]|uniref:hypothetical protein n=1 Tax=Vibrio brasiliensis TaxID=170652 RepID=UPI001EFD5051|nr:hypothetical protein [Vibrio brasiliensis]MCG9725157.1 hypothetical protein [Vibrio brasiliensis]
MTIYDYIANYIQSTYKYEKTEGFWARLFYLTPEQRVQRLNEIFDTDKFWQNTTLQQPIPPECQSEDLTNGAMTTNE